MPGMHAIITLLRIESRDKILLIATFLSLKEWVFYISTLIRNIEILNFYSALFYLRFYKRNISENIKIIETGNQTNLILTLLLEMQNTFKQQSNLDNVKHMQLTK